MPEYSTTEIAAKCRVSERTIQRWIKDKMLPAREIMRNRYIVNDADIERLKPRTIQAHRDELTQSIEHMGTLIEALQHRMERLEQRVEELTAQRTASVSRKHDTQLPAGVETLSSFAKLHTVSPSSYKRAAESIGAEKYGNTWYLVDEQSKTRFYQKFHVLQGFTKCVNCPHITS